MTELVGCVNGTNCIRTRSGKYLDLACPKFDDIVLEDIAGALSKLCRFSGQIDFHYSVAEHSYICSMVAEDDGNSANICRSVLMHDAAEAYCGDVVRPLKKMLPEYAAIERRLMSCIAEKFDLNFSFAADIIHEIDNAVVLAERRQVWFDQDDVEWHGESTVRKVDITVVGWEPRLAEEVFMIRANELGIGLY